MRQWIGLAAGLTLAACGGEGGGSGNGSGNGAAGGGGGGTTAVQMQPGEWELTSTTTRMVVPGRPGAPLPQPRPVRQCVTPEQAASVTGAVIRNIGQNGECTMQTNAASGGRIQATVQCRIPHGGTATFTVDGSYTATTLEMTQQVRTSGAAANVEMDMRTTGRRIGDCPAGGASQGNQQ